MREMNLPALSVPASLGHSIGLFQARSRPDNPLGVPVAASMTLIAYMAWPNDEPRRDSWVATTLGRQATLMRHVSVDSIPTLDVFGGLKAISEPAFAHLVDELEGIMKGWPPVADVMSRLVDMANDARLTLRGGPSIAKAIELSDFEPEGLSRSQSRRFWARSRDVAPLLAAAAFIAAKGTHSRSCAPFAAAWFAPESVLSIAAGFEEFGLITTPHGQTDPLLSPETTWRVPVACRPAPAFLVTRKLSDAQIDFLESRRSPKKT